MRTWQDLGELCEVTCTEMTPLSIQMLVGQKKKESIQMLHVIE